MKQTRKFIDCRNFPNEMNCSLTISGLAREVLRASLRHAVEEHGHKDTPELRKQLRLMLKEGSDKGTSNQKTKNPHKAERR